MRGSCWPLTATFVLTLGASHGALAQDAHTMAPFGAVVPRTQGPLASALEAAATSDYPRAEKELAAIGGAERATAQLALARVLLQQGRFAEADRAAGGAGGGPDDALEAVALRAQASLERGRAPDALKLLQAAKDTGGRGGRAVRLMLGEVLIALGRRADADRPLHAIIDEYNADGIAEADAAGLAAAGRAGELLRSSKDANRLFNESERADPKLADGLLWHSRLFLDKYDPGHAEETIEQARKVAPNRPDLAVQLARVKLEQTLDFDAAERLVGEAISRNPHLASAYAVRAAVALHDGDFDASSSAIASGLAENPSDLELLSLRAAERLIADDRPGFQAAKSAVFARNREYARFYEIVAELAEWEHRYADIVDLMKEAVTVDPDDAKAFAELGLMQMRDGDEQGGLAALREAWKKDHFNVRVFNTLNLYEQTIAPSYDLATHGVFTLRYPKNREKVLDRYVPRMLGEAWASMKARYGFVPSTPVQVELYSNREQFSVRTSGLPNVGIEGVCFGHVLAAILPETEPFNWGNVLWHELGHVFAIQLSRSRVPRWFTEGLSEYETIVRRPEWQRHLDPELYQALMAGKVPGAVQMNRAFTHAADGDDMNVAYYAASQMVVFTVEELGMPAVVRALSLWGQGKRTPDVLKEAFGLTPEEYDARYRAWQRARLARYDGQFLPDERPQPLADAKAKVEASPRDARLQTRYALSLVHAHKLDEARAALHAALAADPSNADAHFLSARIALGRKDTASAAADLTSLQAARVDGYSVQMLHAEVAALGKDKVAERRALEVAVRFDPSQADPLRRLVQIADADKRPADALELLARLAPLAPHDRRAWGVLLERLVEAQRWEQAVGVGESALFVDLANPNVHIAYGRALAALGAHERAAFELETATLCDAPAKVRSKAAALLGREKLALHDVAGARKARDAALLLDPTNAEAGALVVDELPPPVR